MQVALHVGRQAVEPARAAPRGEGRLEGRGVARVVDDIGDEVRGRGGDEDGEDGGGGQRGCKGVG